MPSSLLVLPDEVKGTSVEFFMVPHPRKPKGIVYGHCGACGAGTCLDVAALGPSPLSGFQGTRVVSLRSMSLLTPIPLALPMSPILRRCLSDCGDSVSVSGDCDTVLESLRQVDSRLADTKARGPSVPICEACPGLVHCLESRSDTLQSVLGALCTSSMVGGSPVYVYSEDRHVDFLVRLVEGVQQAIPTLNAVTAAMAVSEYLGRDLIRLLCARLSLCMSDILPLPKVTEGGDVDMGGDAPASPAKDAPKKRQPKRLAADTDQPSIMSMFGKPKRRSKKKK
ncbi:hypothetical protein KIPB_003184 [Kipferlia bialata]|uniref:Uncharacterized protein n=1 Tax=Kipferlia bialata TaxID=797122 RepID=A0A9K3CTD0_9EUKA|nr:hypothetical protein KIPB_003184 [Kipferlia bialata]|eukprot:g3184.t1